MKQLDQTKKLIVSGFSTNCVFFSGEHNFNLEKTNKFLLIYIFLLLVLEAIDNELSRIN